MEKNKDLNGKKVLIIRLSALGDTIHTLPLANALKEEYPNIQIDWIVEDKAAKFVIKNPLINKTYKIPSKKWKKLSIFKKIKSFIQIIRLLRRNKYDIIIDTQQLLKSSLIMGLSKGKRKISLDGGREGSWIFANEIIKTGLKPFDINYHVVKRNLEIAKYLGCNNLNPKFIIPNFENEISAEIKNIINSLDKSKKTIVLAPATTWKNKHWTIQGWLDLINKFQDKYNLIITASEKEKTLTGEILSKANTNKIIDLSGKTTLADLTYLYGNVDLLISPDSGSAHIAWAAGKCKIITLFFATSSGRTAPFGDKYFSVQAEIGCSPCMTKKCRFKKGKNRCCEKINSDKIISIVKNILQ
ncbi:glycosyltransferase family 9 protein [bacterium]|nr:glycosyltransferase family 9 protein [bacterium]